MEKENEVVGRLAEVVEERRPLTTYVLGTKGKRLKVLLPSGKETTVSAHQVLLFSRKRYQGLSRQEILDLLVQKQSLREDLKKELDLKELWELILGEGESFDPYELAAIYWGAKASEDATAALVRAALEDRLYFRFRAGTLQVRSPEEVERELLARKREEERLWRLSQGERFLSQLMQGGSVEEIPAEIREHFLAGLKELCLAQEETARLKETREVLKRLKATGPETPFRLLVKAGIFQEDENLELWRFRIPREFPPAVLEEASQLSEKERPREDLREKDVFTIDAPDTQDFDDALHFEDQGDHLIVGVHITDVSSVVAPETKTFEEARRRGATLYLPERIIPMLPPLLSENRLSLREGEDRPAVSFEITFSPAGEILDYRLYLSRIRVARRLTYEEVDQWLKEGDPFWTRFYQLSQAFLERRQKQGALTVVLPEIALKVVEGKIQLERLEFTPARSLVAEFMVAANFVAARFLHQNQIPALYRYQKEPLARILNPGERDLVKMIQQLRFMVRGEIGVDPEFHHGLGLPEYTTVTSPIRRFMDLVVQHQLGAYLAGEVPPFQREDLQKMLLEIEEKQSALQQVKNRTQRYWLLKYLKLHGQGQRFPALVIEAGERRARVLLPDFMLQAELLLPPGQRVRAGEEIQVRIQRVNPRLEILKLALA